MQRISLSARTFWGGGRGVYTGPPAARVTMPRTSRPTARGLLTAASMAAARALAPAIFTVDAVGIMAQSAATNLASPNEGSVSVSRTDCARLLAHTCSYGNKDACSDYYNRA